MVSKARRISVRSLVAIELEAYAEEAFPELMAHRDHREDAIQELAMVERFTSVTLSVKEKLAIAYRSLAWLSYELGVSEVRPDDERPEFAPLPIVEEGNWIQEISDMAEAALERNVAA